MPYRSNLAAAKARVRAAQDAGLVAAGTLYRNRMKVALARGYTSGDFVTGESVRHVALVGPEDAPGGGRRVRVGTDLLFNLFWEIGHENAWSRRYERVEKWRPVLVDSRADIQREFDRAFTLTMRGGA